MPTFKDKSSKHPKKNVLRMFVRGRIAKKRNLRAHTITAMIPNITTLMALCCGMTAIRFALLENWSYAITSILLSAVLDALDGRLARLLKSSSRFGAELDSFSDFLSFGVAPALIIYLKALHMWGEIGWAISLFFAICMSLRLARFNVMSVDLNQSSWQQGFFKGVPAPIGGFLGLYPIILGLAYPTLVSTITPVWYAFFMTVSALLMVSRIPTFSIKKVVIPPVYVMPFLLVLFILIGFLYSYPWQTLSMFGVFYVVTIPFSMKNYSKFMSMEVETGEDPMED